MKRMLLVALLALPLSAEIINYKDCKWLYRKNPGGKPDKVEGKLAIDRTWQYLGFVKKDNLRVSVPLDRVTGATYRTKGDKILTLRYQSKGDAGEFQEFELNGDVQNAVLATLESMGIRIERVER